MNRNTFLLLALGSCTLAGLTVSCDRLTGGKAPAETAEAKAPAVKVFPLLQQEVTENHSWFGYLRGEMDTDIHPRVSGIIASQEYADGTYVKEGTVLFRIDDSLFKAQLAQAEANLAAALASVEAAHAAREMAELDVQRFEGMGAKVVSEKTISDARQRKKAAIAGESAAAAAVEQATAAVENARIQLDYTVVRAPYSGVVGTSDVSIGDLVSPATKLANISAVDKMRVLFSINGANMINVFRKYGDVSDPAAKAINVPFYLDMEDGTTFPIAGEFAALESIVEPNGVINVEGRCANPTHTLRSGMPVRVRIPARKFEALLVPKAAVQTQLRNRFIIFMAKDGTPHLAPVKVLGEYPVEVHEENGYVSTQTMVAVGDATVPLADIFKAQGYDSPVGVPVVSDSDNGVIAMKTSSSNSRLEKGEKPAVIETTPFTFKPEIDPALLAAVKEAEGQQPAPAPDAKPTIPPVSVKVTPMILRGVHVPGEWFGTLRGVEETEIRPQVSGFLTSQVMQDGLRVKKGDVLFTIDPAPYQAALDEARANVSVAKAALAQQEAELEMNRTNSERYERLNRENPGSVSAKSVTDAATAVKTATAAVLKARAAVAQAEAAERMAEINLGYTTITAPFDGRVGIHKPSVGALVSPQDPQPLVTISSMDPIRVDFNISGKDALATFAYVHQARRAGKDVLSDITLDVLLEDGSLYPAKGHISNMDNSLDTATGTLKVSGLLANADGGLRSGMPVRVRAFLSAAEENVLVPARAPLSAQGRDVLVLLKPDGTPEMLPIKKLDMVNIPLPDAEGKEVLQPMQCIDVDRDTVGTLILLKTGAPTLESLVLKGAEAADWADLLLKKAGVADFRELAQKAAGGKPLPDELPAGIGAADWKEYVLRTSGCADFRELVLQQADAQDELDLIARGQGFGTVFEMVLKQMGYERLEDTRVVVEGAIMAAQAFGANQAAGVPVNKLTPVPFKYVQPKTVVDSVTAEQQ